MNLVIWHRSEVSRCLLKLVVLAPLVLAFYVHTHRYYHSHDFHTQMTQILAVTFGTFTLLGLASVLFQFVLRRFEHGVAVVFFGAVAFVMVVNITTEFFSSGFGHGIHVDFICALLYFAICVGGVCFEFYRQRGACKIHAA